MSGSHLEAADALDAWIAEVAARVDRTILAGDSMHIEGRSKHYFSVGASALRAVALALRTAGSPTPRRILDFGCGYGRVARFLRAGFPDAELLVGDVDTSAAAACAQAFGASTIESSMDFEALAPPGAVDLVWCGSVLTHLDAPRWTPLVRFFAGSLGAGGVAVATTHGRRAIAGLLRGASYGLSDEDTTAVVAEFRAHGFAYAEYPRIPGYGVSFATPSWALARVAEVPSVRVIGYVEAGWDNHQDVVVMRDGGF